MEWDGVGYHIRYSKSTFGANKNTQKQKSITTNTKISLSAGGRRWTQAGSSMRRKQASGLAAPEHTGHLSFCVLALVVYVYQRLLSGLTYKYKFREDTNPNTSVDVYVGDEGSSCL